MQALKDILCSGTCGRRMMDVADDAYYNEETHEFICVNCYDNEVGYKSDGRTGAPIDFG